MTNKQSDRIDSYWKKNRYLDVNYKDFPGSLKLGNNKIKKKWYSQGGI